MEGKSPKRTIFTSSGLGLLLQMVSEPCTERCANKAVGSQGKVYYEISHRLERRTKHSL